MAFVVNAFIIIVKRGPYLLVFFLKMLKRHMIVLSKSLLKLAADSDQSVSDHKKILNAIFAYARVSTL